jgi:histidyl-tRNA synthetase
MKHFERDGFRESLDKVIASVAHAYGFTNAPVTIPKKQIAGGINQAEECTLLIAALAGGMGQSEQNTQAWGVLKGKGKSHVVYAIANPAHAIAQAFVIKASLATASSSGFEECTVLITSVGDDESRRRYVREMGNFFKKNAKILAEDFPQLPIHDDPDQAIHIISESDHALATSLPRTIDYLSEPSRKVMLETIALLEKLAIPYELSPRLAYIPETHKEVVFAIEGSNKKGERVIVASGGRFEEQSGTRDKKETESVMGIAIAVPETLDARSMRVDETPTCFVVHVGEAAKLKAFQLLGSLWNAHIALDQALLASTIEQQMQYAQKSGAKYVTIIGQREALDETAIVRNAATQLQETLPLDKMITKLSKAR